MDESLREQLARIYAETKTIAVVGISRYPFKPSQRIPKYLQEQGYRIRPVNPRGGSVLGEPVARSLSEVDGPVDVVDVFRPADEAPKIARQAIDIGAKVLWLQEGIESQEAKRIAEAAGLTVVMNRCMGETHAELGLGRGPG
jgi:predicted CoA-binding protein